jgi:predicted nucleotidyltransferase component of viral defense system
MLARYECRSRDGYVNALREILLDVALLGLWRSKFFEHAAFYGDTALRLLHGMDRFSRDLDFSLLQIDKYAGQYEEITRKETGRPGAWYYSFIISMNLALAAGIGGFILAKP